MGLKDTEFAIRTDGTFSGFVTDHQDALSLRAHEYYAAPPVAYTFSKCQRKGSELILSGEEGYSNIILPLVKALHYLQVSEAPPPTARFFDVRFAQAVAVLDAPMVEYRNGEIESTSWVRILRHEAGAGQFGRGMIWAIDIVHRDFFAEYLSDHILPASADFRDRVLRHATEVAECKGYVPEMRGNHDNLEAVLQPASAMPIIPKKRAVSLE